MEQKIIFPEDRIPILRLVPMGLQHVVAMFGATVLAWGARDDRTGRS